MKVAGILKRIKEKQPEKVVVPLKQYVPSGAEDTYSAIDKIPIEDLVCSHFGWFFDGKKYFFSEPDMRGKKKACFKSTEGNFLCHGGTDHLAGNRTGYSPFNFIKDNNNLNDKETFEWFKSQYPSIKEMSDKEKENFTKNKDRFDISEISGNSGKKKKEGNPGNETTKNDSREEKRNFDGMFTFKTTKDILKGMASMINNQDVRPYTWGTEMLDKNFTAISRGDYIILAGETGMGKTVFSLHFAIENAKKGLRILYVSLEMSNEGMIHRYLRDVVGISAAEERNCIVPEYKIDQYIHEGESIPDNLVIVDIDSSCTRDHEMVRAMVEQERWDLVIVDNLGFMDAEGDTDLERQKALSRGISELCNEKREFAFVGIHHFRKGGSNKPRSLDDLMGSAKKSHDASFVCQVWRDREKDKDSSLADRAKLQFLIQKDRDRGNEGSFNVYYKRGQFFDQYNELPTI